MKKAQAWGTDLGVGLTIFLIAIIVFSVYSLNLSSENSENTLQQLNYESEYISDIILSPGSPQNWNEDNVLAIGITSENKINQTKLNQFYTLAKNNYQKTKAIFNTNYDYYFFLDTEINTPEGLKDGIGKPGINRNNINASNLVKITRLTVYKNQPITAYLYIFED